MAHPNILVPSILAGNHANLLASLEEIHTVESIDWVHLDIMDGHFVPNLTFGPKTIADLRPHSDLYFDTHLMLDNPQDYIEAFIQAGSNNVTIHVEPDYDIPGTLTTIKELGADCGISLNPATDIKDILPYIEQVDLVLVMSVNPGFGGQTFKASALEKLKYLENIRKERSLKFRIQVDGGVNQDNITSCIDSGADTLVAGTAFFDPASREFLMNKLS